MSDFARLRELVGDALEQPASEREEWLRSRCDDPSLLREALELIVHDVGAQLTNAVDSEVARSAASILDPGLRPERISSYQIVDTLGSGGMGVVYRAVQSGALDREVALKLIRPGFDSRRVVTRFESERRALARMEHPNIAQVFDAGTTADGLPWFAMELVDGEPIDRWCDERALSIEDRLTLFEGVCRGVQHAHQKGIIHRDLKLSNILVTRRDGKPIAKIIDFGISKALGDANEDGSMKTVEGQILGTPEYMSPERLEGNDDDVDIRSDVYSLGVLLYHLLSGSLPFDRSSVWRTGTGPADLQSAPPRPSHRVTAEKPETEPAARHRSAAPVQLRRQLEGDLDWITLKALALEPDQRYATVQELLQDIERHRTGLPVLAGPPTVRYRLGKFIRRHRASVSVAALILLLLAGGLIESNRQRLRAESALEEADAVTEFLSEMLASLQPEEMGKDVTVRQALDQANLALDEELHDRPLVRARLLTTIGRTYMVLGEFEVAEVQLDEALKIRDSMIGSRSPAALETRYHRATLYVERGRLDEATSEFESVLASRREVLGDLHSHTLGTLASLGSALHRMGQSELALASFTESYAGFLATKGPRDLDTLHSQRNLGDIHGELGDNALSEMLLTEVLEIHLEQDGPDHPATMSAMSSMAFLYYQTGDYEKCEKMLSSVLESRRRTRGEHHLVTLEAMINLSSIRSSLDMLDSATELLLEALPICRSTFGDEHRTTLTCLNNLAWIYSTQGRYDDAEPLLLEAVDTRRRIRGEDHINTLISANNLGELYQNTGRAVRAEKLHREVLALRKQSLGENHSHVMISMTNLATALREQGRFAEADAIYSESWAMQSDQFGNDHPDARKTAEEAVTLHEKWSQGEALEIWRERAGDEDSGR